MDEFVPTLPDPTAAPGPSGPDASGAVPGRSRGLRSSPSSAGSRRRDRCAAAGRRVRIEVEATTGDRARDDHRRDRRRRSLAAFAVSRGNGDESLTDTTPDIVTDADGRRRHGVLVRNRSECGEHRGFDAVRDDVHDPGRSRHDGRHDRSNVAADRCRGRHVPTDRREQLLRDTGHGGDDPRRVDADDVSRQRVLRGLQRCRVIVDQHEHRRHGRGRRLDRRAVRESLRDDLPVRRGRTDRSRSGDHRRRTTPPRPDPGVGGGHARRSRRHRRLHRSRRCTRHRGTRRRRLRRLGQRGQLDPSHQPRSRRRGRAERLRHVGRHLTRTEPRSHFPNRPRSPTSRSCSARGTPSSTTPSSRTPRPT